jgi:hypothetical protein
MIPLFLGLFKAFSIFFKFFDQWLIRLGELAGKGLRKLSNFSPRLWIEGAGNGVSKAGNHLVETMEHATSGSFAGPLIEKGDAVLERMTSEKLTGSLVGKGDAMIEKLSSDKVADPMHRVGEAVGKMAGKSGEAGAKMMDEGEMTVRKAVYRANRSISTVTYSIFLFGAILVLSFIFIFLNSTLIKYEGVQLYEKAARKSNKVCLDAFKRIQLYVRFFAALLFRLDPGVRICHWDSASGGKQSICQYYQQISEGLLVLLDPGVGDRIPKFAVIHTEDQTNTPC